MTDLIRLGPGFVGFAVPVMDGGIVIGLIGKAVTKR